ncbi:hypothetical protein CAS74_000170 [Pichia kudriavzevii]|uniref:BolA-like protein n=1 Tax=Pichia kudriavzevii TaxID=4909 RepID=A0A1Z8JTC4_PICKU|nr:hypothetical protein CAS74_000170 [Pichia kudriavzevii]
MSLTAESLSDIIRSRLEATEVEVQDIDVFQGKNKLARHRLVNSALKDEISAIHAFTQKVFTVAEWEEQKKLFSQ